MAAGGVDGLIIENFFDAPFTKQQVDPAVVSAMTLIVDRIKNLVVLPIGLNVLRNDAHSALEVVSQEIAKYLPSIFIILIIVSINILVFHNGRISSKRGGLDIVC